MRFIKLTKIDGPEIVIQTSAIVAMQADIEMTWVTLATGEKFCVDEFAVDILYSIGAECVEVEAAA